MSRKSSRKRPTYLRIESLEDRTTPTGSPGLRAGYTFSGPGYDDNNPAIAGPAAPQIAVGNTNEVAVTEAQVQVRSIPNGTSTQISLQSFFNPLSPNAATVWSNPRTIYDPYNNRFVVAAIGTVPAISASELFIAVSSTPTASTNTGNWHEQAISTAPNIGGVTYAGYMGLGLDQQVVYATTSQLLFSNDTYQDARLLILDKTIGSGGGWYGGGTPTNSALLDPGTSGIESQFYGLVPATMYTTPTAPPIGVGTYLVAYNGSPGSGGGNESTLVVRVDNPTTSPTFTPTTITVGNIDDTSTALPLAPEPHTGSNGSALDINPGPRRVGNAVWRDDRLYFATTIKTPGGADAAHWFQVLTTNNTVEKQADVNTTPLASGLYSYDPGIAVDVNSAVAVAYAVSNGSNAVRGAYSARTATDAGSTLRDPVAVTSATSNEYIRRDAAGNNFWGPYSGIAIAPNDKVFWTFNSAADAPASSGTAPDFGRWFTTGGAFSFNWPPDTTGIPNINTQDDVPPFQIFLNQYFSDLETTNAANFSYTVSSSDTTIAQVSMSSQQVMDVVIPRPTAGTAQITVTCTDAGTVDAPPASITTTFNIHVVHVDHPAQVTIDQDPAQPDPTNGPSVVFDVVFDQAVTGFGPAGVSLTASTDTGMLVAAVAGSGANYTVTVTGMAGDGDVIATVKANAAFNPSSQGNLDSTSTDNTVTVDYIPPTVTVNESAGQADPTNGSVKFDVVFSEPVLGFTGAKVDLSGGTAPGAVASVTGSGPAYTVTVSGMTASGTVVAKIDTNAVTDLAGNGNVASTSTDNTVTFDNVPPTETIAPSAGQFPAAGGTSVKFDVVFSEPVVNFVGSAVDLSSSTTGGSLVAAVSGSGANYTVTVTGMAAGGTVVASIPAGRGVTDLAGNGNVASGSASVTYVHSGTVQFSAPSYAIDEQGAPTLTVTVTRTGGTEGALTVNYAATDGTAKHGTDYGTPSGTGTLSWTAGDSSVKTFTIPMLDDATLEADKAFTVGLSGASVPGALGSPATATVNIQETAAFSIDAAPNPASEGDTVTVTVHRLFGTHGVVSVNYAATGGTATAGSDYGPLSGTGTLTWADGDTADKTFTIPILTDTLSEGRETIDLALSSPTGNSELGTQSTTVVTIAASNGKAPGTFLDANGDLVTLKLTGPGTLTYFLTNDTAPISEIDLSGTDSTKSVVSLTIKKSKLGTGRVDIGEIDGTGVKTLSLSKADLNGAVGNGINLTSFLGSLSIGAIENGADITLAGAPPTAKSATKITAGVIGDGTDLTITGAPLASLTATAVGVGNISAPSVGSITVKGKAKTKTTAAIPGDFKSNLTIAGTGLPVKTAALKSLKVAGSVSGSTIRVGGLDPATSVGDVGSVSVGSFVNSQLFAGYTGPTNGTGTFNLPSTISSFTVKGTTTAFAHSFVIASNFKTVSLASADTNNSGTKFGFVFHTTFGTLAVENPELDYNKTTGGTQVLSGDLEVLKV